MASAAVCRIVHSPSSIETCCVSRCWPCDIVCQAFVRLTYHHAAICALTICLTAGHRDCHSQHHCITAGAWSPVSMVLHNEHCISLGTRMIGHGWQKMMLELLRHCHSTPYVRTLCTYSQGLRFQRASQSQRDSVVKTQWPRYWLRGPACLWLGWSHKAHGEGGAWHLKGHLKGVCVHRWLTELHSKRTPHA